MAPSTPGGRPAPRFEDCVLDVRRAFGRRTSGTSQWLQAPPARARWRRRRTRRQPSARRQPRSSRFRRRLARRIRPWSCCLSLKLRLDFGGWGEFSISVPSLGRSRNRGRERSGRTGLEESVMSASRRQFCRWRAPENSCGQLRLNNRCGRTLRECLNRHQVRCRWIRPGATRRVCAAYPRLDR